MCRRGLSWVLLGLALLVWCGPAPAQTFEIPRTANQWKRVFIKAHREVWGLRTPAAVAAQIGQESGWRDGLTSRAGARGMCQAMPATAEGMERQNKGLADLGRYSPSWCFRFQALLMKQLYNQYSDVRDECNAMKFALSAYNGGPGMLNREIGLCHRDRATCDYEHWDEHVARRNARASWAWKENRDYVFRIMTRGPTYAADGWGERFCPKPILMPSLLAPRPERTPQP